MEIFRRMGLTVLGMIDSAIYQLIGFVYQLLLDIAEAKPFSDELFKAFADRIYALLGLFMLFKVSFSLIKYIANPDDFNDKVKGGKKMVMNILIVLVMIVVTPMAFEKLKQAQDIILQDQVLEKVILGTGADVLGESIDRDKVGDDVKVAIFSAFYRPDNEACAQKDPANPDQFASSSECSSFMGTNVARAYAEEYRNGNVNGMIFREVDGEPIFMHKAKTGDSYAVNYMIIIATIAGGFTAWIFLVFCIDIAIRTVKLGFLQLIAPIPIISYIDPSSSKNGMFSKWLKEVGKTWADLFIRLGAVYFAITLISALMRNTNLGTDSFLARVFIIFGILIFANQIPKLLGDLMGTKIDGNFSLNPLNKVNSSPLAGAALGGVVGLGAGVASNVASIPKRFGDFKDGVKQNGFMNTMTDGNHFRKINEDGSLGGIDFQGSRKAIGSMIRHTGSAFTGFAGGGSGMVRGMINGSRGKGSAIQSGLTGAEASSRARNARGGGYTFVDKLHDKATDIAGIRSKTGTTSQLGDEIKANERQIENYKRDQQSDSQLLADLKRSNPISYTQAFDRTPRKENGSVVRDEKGEIIYDSTYKDYDSYFRGMTQITEENILQAIQQRVRDGQFTDDEAGHAAARRYIYDTQAQAHGIITQKQYDEYKVIESRRDKANTEARLLEKRNKELQGYMDAKSGKPKQ